MERRRHSLHGSDSSTPTDFYPLHPPFVLPGQEDFEVDIRDADDQHDTPLVTSSGATVSQVSSGYRNSPVLAPPAIYPQWTPEIPRHSRSGSAGASAATFERHTPSDMSDRELRPQRPSGPARTPSNTYAPPRRPPQFSTHSSSQLSYSAKRPSRRDPNAQYRAQEKAYVQRVRQGPPNEWLNFGSQIPGVPDIDLDLEDESPSSEPFDSDPYDVEAHLVLEDENIQPTLEELQNPKIREKLEWHSMLASVLKGDVVKQEKRRLFGTGEPKSLTDINDEIWLGIRARSCGRLEALQKKIIEHERAQVGPILEEIISFKIKGETEIGKPPVKQVEGIVAKIEKVESLYSVMRELKAHHKRADSEEFTASCDAIISWHNTTQLINTQFAILQRWVGNEELNFNLPITKPSHAADLADEGSFLDRIMKEDGLKSLQGDGNVVDGNGQTRKNSMLDGIGEVIKKAKATLIENSEAFVERHLPPYIEELLILISFPSRLIVEVIRVRLSYAKKMKDPGQQSPMLLDQMIAQFQILMKIAVEIKQRYLVISEPEPGWELPPCFEESFDTVVVDALKYYFKLLNWKLSANKNTFKEAEILEQEWDFSNEIGRQFEGGDIEVAEQFSTLTAKALQRLMLHFERELLGKPEGDAVESEKRYKQILDSVRVRQRKLFRFSRFLRERFENATEFHLKDDIVETFSEALLASGHFLVTSLDSVGQKGVSLIASPSLYGRPKDIQSILGTSFRAEDVPEDPSNPYILVIRPEKPFPWSGKRMEVDLLEHPTDVRLGKLRLVADGSQKRLQSARAELTRLTGLEFDVTVEQRANLGRVNVELNKIKKTAWKLSNTIIDSVEIIRKQNQGAGNQELIQSCFAFATEFGKRSLMYLEPTRRSMNHGKLVRLGVDWVAFVCDDCDAADRRTFKWAVAALEFAMAITHGHSILSLSDEDYQLLRAKVAGCMSTLISHFDIMGARSTLAAKAEKLQLLSGKLDLSKAMDDAEAEQAVHEQRYLRVAELEQARAELDSKRRPLGRVLEGVNEADRSLTVLSSSATNVTLRWQQGQFIGGGTSGSVYAAIDLDTSYLMAVKEIKLQEPSVIPGVAQQIRDEMAVLEVLDHPNIVSYRGIEVHRDKVYIFMEYCSGGSMATLLEHGRIEDETVIMVYALQMLEGLAYLHQAGIVHRDIKPANILLDHNGVIKYVDFGAAMIIARQGKTLAAMDQYGGNHKDATKEPHAQRKNQKSVTGTPMYMSPELVRGEVGHAGGRHGSMDIWSLGCVILEMATGLRPWAGIDNEWAIMYKIAQGNQPHLPTPDQLSELGIDFIKRCFELDPAKRPSAVELLQHEWIVTIRRQVVAEPPTPSSEVANSQTSSSTSSRQNSSMF
ncbi:STE/STE11/SSK protein kinase [Coccidioides immitis RS]|uniref:MAP kinase kinase kinase n=2 Tax=Coccidioides immitis TaxID=5501 RepID=J3K993_COCIM|nr:STE/STE11/SSK protein kinase [Coccidioides immitis RS]EAS31453.3 STE/STE11/SSK protein kinase [Coccidioides immitis RS]KMP04102.1 MAP kinase kinase kinase wis4 [Coccidioides immitis RMSCC 2394]TPX24243.1 Suppressor of Sensor Kinase (SLN1) [Coccidioides immitis]